MGTIPVEHSSRNRTCLPVSLEWRGGSKKTTALVDSGAEESFMDTRAAKEWRVPLEITRPRVANSISGQKIGYITHATAPLKMRVSGNHQEEIKLHLIDSPHSPVILGHPWMAKHNPKLDWGKHEIKGWSPNCSQSCLVEANVHVHVPPPEEIPNLEKVPTVYHDLKEVFSKSRATCLPPS